MSGHYEIKLPHLESFKQQHVIFLNLKSIEQVIQTTHHTAVSDSI